MVRRNGGTPPDGIYQLLEIANRCDNTELNSIFAYLVELRNTSQMGALSRFRQALGFEISAMIVKAEIAGQAASSGGDVPYEPGETGQTDGISEGMTTTAPEPAVLSRFYGTVDLDNPLRLGSEGGRIADEVLTHLAALPRAKVRVTLEIQTKLPCGANDHTVRTVTENARTLKFHNAEFEPE